MNRPEINEKSRSEWLSLIEEWVHNERDRAILARHMLDGVTIERIAEEYDLSVTRTFQLIKRARAQLLRHL